MQTLPPRIRLSHTFRQLGRPAEPQFKGRPAGPSQAVMRPPDGTQSLIGRLRDRPGLNEYLGAPRPDRRQRRSGGGIRQPGSAPCQAGSGVGAPGEGLDVRIDTAGDIPALAERGGRVLIESWLRGRVQQDCRQAAGCTHPGGLDPQPVGAESCPLMRPGSIRGSGRRVVPPADAGYLCLRRADPGVRRAGSGAASCAADGCCNSRRTRRGPVAGAIRR